MFDERTAERLKLLAADLLSGIVELSRYTLGLPEPLQGRAEDPAAVLSRLLASVEPSDLPTGARGLWRRARALHARSLRITWDGLLVGASDESRRFASFVEKYGLAVAYQAIPAAGRLVVVSDAAGRFRNAQAESAAALEAIERGVAGVGA